ncbi:MAG: response regulator receiver domain [Pseudomonadota bacterium]
MSTAFAEYCNNSAKEFINNVLVIDDGASIGYKTESTTPKIAQRPSASVMAEVKPVSDETKTTATPPTDSSHSLDASQLTDSFFSYGIIVGLFKPTPANIGEIIPKTVSIAKKTDAVILDWSIDPKNPNLCKEIIRAIIDDDHMNGGGRLRTIVIYTAEKDLNGLLKDLISYLSENKIEDFLTGNAIVFNELDQYTIKSLNLRISFYSKAHGGSPDPTRKKTEAQLPDVVVNEFSAHTQGLLPTFALVATTAIRKNTYHLLTRFTSDLDGPYLAHRGMLQDQEDAEPFMLENFVSVIRNILSLEGVDRQSLGKNSISNFLVDRNSKTLNYSGPINTETITFTPNEISVAFNGESTLLKFMKSKGITNKQIETFGEDKLLIELAKILADNESKSLYQFSVLTSFRRSHADVGWASPNHIPYLTQGTVIAEILPNNNYNFFFCVTPKCDSVRIKQNIAGIVTGAIRSFSFAKLDIATEISEHDLIANVKGVYFHLKTQQKFYKLCHIDFRSDDLTHRIEAVYNEPNKQFLMKDDSGNEFLWIGDLKDLHSQNRVSGLVGDLNRIGFDEFEWLRRKQK